MKAESVVRDASTPRIISANGTSPSMDGIVERADPAHAERCRNAAQDWSATSAATGTYSLARRFNGLRASGMRQPALIPSRLCSANPITAMRRIRL
ncbi:hypothetical protein [Agromyces badenianii]|uniref:hypothetical protein n=1 Tax=Agromyces badenianii TaxID=2080742 RepID=UPI00105949B7|nr:hypothetical protein [Agromyces badenianii]